MTDPIKIVFLTTEGPASFYLINEIHRDYPVAKVFFRHNQGSPLNSKLSKIFNMSKVRGHFRYYLEQFFFSKEQALKKDYEKSCFPQALDPAIPAERVESLNSPESVAKIAAEKPDIILVQGTEILHENVLAIAKREIINIHPGILPDYKGGGLPYWSFYNKDFDRLGVTIHVCTNQLDGGPILGQAFYQLTPEDKIYQFSHRINRLFVTVVKETLASYLSGDVKYQQQKPSSKVWTKKGLTIVKQLLARKYFRDHVDSL